MLRFFLDRFIQAIRVDAIPSPVESGIPSPYAGIARFLPYIVLFLSLSLTLCFWFLYDSSLKAREYAFYKDKTQEISSHILRRMRRDEQVLRGGVGLFNASIDVTRDEWRRYVSSLKLSENYPGIQGVGFSAWLLPSEVEQNVRQIRAKGFPEYTIHPAGNRPAYTSIIYLEPFDWRNQRAFGYDMFSEPVRRAAMEMAKDSGDAILSGKVQLIQETGKDIQYGILMYLPVYRHGIPTDTIENRRKAIRGFVYCPIRIRDFMYATLGKMPHDIAFELYASETPNPDSLLFSSVQAEKLVVPEPFKPDYQSVESFDAYGRRWVCVFKALPPFSANLNWVSSVAVLIGGILVSLLLTLISFMLLTSRNRAFDAAITIRESENRYHALFDHSPDGIVIVDPETTRFIDFNDQACRQLGYSREEFGSLHLVEIECSESVDAVSAHIQRIIRDGSDEFDTKLVTRQGDARITHVKAQFTNIRGKYVYHCIWRDITKEKKEEQLLQARLHLIEFGYTSRLDELLTETLDKVEELTGSQIGFYHFLQDDQRTLTLHAWSTRTSKDFCRAEGGGSHYDIDKAGVWVDCIHQRKPVVHNDYAALPHRKGMPPGHAGVIRELVVPIFRSDRIVGILGIGNKASDYTEEDTEIVSRFADLSWDIAERKQVQESLLESDNRFSAAFNKAPIMIAIYRLEDGTCLDANQRFFDVTEFSRDEVVGTSPAGLGVMSGTDWEQIKGQILRDGEITELELSLQTKSDRKLLCKFWGEMLTVSAQACLLAIAMDITEHRKMEQQYLQAQKMESVGRLAGGVAHDFNNMLAVILGLTELSMQKLPKDDQVREHLEMISKAASRSIDITRQLLAFSRKGLISPRPLKLNNLIAEAEKTLFRLIGEDIKLAFKPAPDLWTVHLDPSQVDQILINLAVNARDAMPNGGDLIIMTRNAHIDATYCQYVLDARPGDFVQVSVSDNGMGMEKETLDHIFEPFFTTKEVGKGTGLGLSTVYGIVTQNGGFIKVYSELRQGTTFNLYFPRMPEEAAPETVPPRTLPSGSGRVLVVEDDYLMSCTTSLILQQMGYQVLIAESPQKAISLCENKDTLIDIILTDVIMPEMNGKEMMERISSIRPGIKVLFMSGYTADVVAQRGVVAEGMHFIQKPFDMNTLYNKLTIALGESGET